MFFYQSIKELFYQKYPDRKIFSNLVGYNRISFLLFQFYRITGLYKRYYQPFAMTTRVSEKYIPNNNSYFKNSLCIIQLSDHFVDDGPYVYDLLLNLQCIYENRFLMWVYEKGNNSQRKMLEFRLGEASFIVWVKKGPSTSYLILSDWKRLFKPIEE